MASTGATVDEDQKMSTEAIDQGDSKQAQVDLREIAIVLDSWSRTCEAVANTLEDQIRKITKADVNNKT